MRLDVVLTMKIEAFHFIAYRYFNKYLIRVEVEHKTHWYESYTLDDVITNLKFEFHEYTANKVKFTPVKKDQSDDTIPF